MCYQPPVPQGSDDAALVTMGKQSSGGPASAGTGARTTSDASTSRAIRRDMAYLHEGRAAACDAQPAETDWSSAFVEEDGRVTRSVSPDPTGHRVATARQVPHAAAAPPCWATGRRSVVSSAR
jgi:hypothetical protein